MFANQEDLGGGVREGRGGLYDLGGGVREGRGGLFKILQ